jgi:hypothetical protein
MPGWLLAIILFAIASLFLYVTVHKAGWVKEFDDED